MFSLDMASYYSSSLSSPKSQKSEVIGFEKPAVNCEDKNTSSDMNFLSQLDLLLRRDLHNSFDLNQNIMIPSTRLDYQNATINKVGKRRVQNATKKKRLMSMSLKDEALTNYGLDLELRLSNSSTLISPKKPTSCPPFDQNSKHDQYFDCSMVSEAVDDQVPSLVLMGCANCYLYVMVSQSDPKCPKCHSSILADSFRGNTSAKRA